MRSTVMTTWLLLMFFAATTIGYAGEPFPPDSVKFEMHRVGTYRGEACGVADFNGDGKLDIVALPYLYLGPDFKPKTITTIKGDVDEEGKGYRWDFLNAPLDCDGDGDLDIVTCSWHGKSSEWLTNPGNTDSQWPRVLIEENGTFECGDLWDIDGDGKALEVLPHVTRTIWYEVGKLPESGIITHLVSEKQFTYGGGVGDVNGDGRPDILRPGSWFEGPADPRQGDWKEHPLPVGSLEEGQVDHTPQIVTYDVNGDGLNDVITSSAHKYGIFWYQQLRDGDEITWKQHLIDKSWSQAHSITLADVDNDGDLDMVTGKRFRAHNGNDPGGLEPPGVYWYELKPGRTPVWTKHVISLGEGIGSGMNVPVVDLDADGDLDIVVTGKWGGPVWFENKAK